jgi:hypothetical protein
MSYALATEINLSYFITCPYMKGVILVELNYEHAQSLVGEIIRYRNEEGEWRVGKILNIKKDGMEIAELSAQNSNNGFGYGFFGPRPFFGRPLFVPFVGFAFFPFLFF